jgi:hypothetical protein
VALSTCGRWFIDETYVKVAGRWAYLYRAVDQHGQVIDVLVSERRNARAARAFFTRALTCGPSPVEVTTRPGTGLSPPGRGARPGRTARPRAVREQPRGIRSRPVKGTVASDAWPQDHPIIADDHGRASLRAEPAPRAHALSVDLPARDRVRVAFGELAPYL